MSSKEEKNAAAREYHQKRMKDPEYVKKRREQGKVNQTKFRQTEAWQKQIWGSNKSSKIYFIQAKSGPIKIGLTRKRAETRLNPWGTTLLDLHLVNM